jgi:hypothetical protein
MSLLDEIQKLVQQHYTEHTHDPQCIYLQRQLWYDLAAEIEDALQVEVVDSNARFFGMLLVLVEHPEHPRVRVI